MKTSASGTPGVHIKLLVLGSLRVLASGCTFNLIKELTKRGLIVPIGTQHHSFDLYRGAQAKSAAEKAEAEAAEAEAAKAKKGKK